VPNSRDEFYEYTEPVGKPKSKLKDQHQFTLADTEWFWIAGIIKQDCFAVLTVKPGPDIRPYHDRQIVVLSPRDGMDWLQLSKPEDRILRALPSGSLKHRQLRRNSLALG